MTRLNEVPVLFCQQKKRKKKWGWMVREVKQTAMLTVYTPHSYCISTYLWIYFKKTVQFKMCNVWVQTFDCNVKKVTKTEWKSLTKKGVSFFLIVGRKYIKPKCFTLSVCWPSSCRLICQLELLPQSWFFYGQNTSQGLAQLQKWNHTKTSMQIKHAHIWKLSFCCLFFNTILQ